jgi:enamine deaminase RidA (YjgF/YER057c/UK114 family)
MIHERMDPPGLPTIAGVANPTIASGTKIVNISGQTGMNAENKVVGTTHLEQTRQALTNLKTAVAAAGGTPADIAKLNIYIVDYSDDAYNALVTAAIEVFGEEYPVTAGTLLGVEKLFQPDILVEIDAMVIL